MKDLPPNYQELTIALPKELVKRLQPTASAGWRRNTLEREIEYRLEHSLEQGRGDVQRTMLISLGYFRSDLSTRIKIGDDTIARWTPRARSQEEIDAGKIHFHLYTGIEGTGGGLDYQPNTYEEVIGLVREDLARIMTFWAVRQSQQGNEHAVDESLKIAAIIRRLLDVYMQQRVDRLPPEQPTIFEHIDI